ncbi:MAG TPA: amino acid adenylation domain-containing protein [Thermoanaerobaculia bacterium]|nr:amino acid adenylation domain-containing protein [Thermoanaerobaculia bacterium]
MVTDITALSREEKLALLARLAQERKAVAEAGAGGPYPLSFAQQRFWFLDQLEPGSYLDNMFRAIRLTGALDRTALERSLKELVRRHASLRTRFPSEAGEPRQVIDPELPPILSLVDLTGLAEEEILPRAIELAGEESRQPFDLARGPLFRARLLRLGSQDHALLLCLHHIVSDGWSQGLLLRELVALYRAYVAGETPSLPEPKVRYVEFARWQTERLRGEALEQELAFWRERLEGAPPVLELPTDHPRRHMASPRGDAVTFQVPESISARVKALAQAEGATPFMALLTLFDVLLFRYTGQGDFLVGVPVANRNRTEFEGVVGCFASTLLVRAEVRRDLSFRELLAQVRSEALAVFAHSDLPFEKLVAEVQPDRNLSHNPLFQVVFTLQNTATAGGGSLTMPGLTLGPLRVERRLAKIDLTLEMVDLPSGSPAGFSGYFEYSTDLFQEATVARMASHFQALLAAVVEEPGRAVGELPLLSAEERQQILIDWNRPNAGFPPPILYRLAQQAIRTPDAAAVLFEDQVMTFAELHGRANRLARHLRRLGVGPEMSVGLCLERSLEMPLALLAVLKSGGAWVPLDPEYPQERLALMIEDTAMPVLLTQEHLVSRLPELVDGPAVICLDHLSLSQEDPSDPDWEIHPESLAYIVYTSGSTGRPKGVAVPHRAMANHVTSCALRYRMGPQDRTLQFTSISFDITSEEIFPTWLMGGGVVPRPPGLFPSFSELSDLIVRYGITAMDLPTAYWHEWVGEMYRSQTPPPPPLRLVVIGTEQALPERVAEWLELVGDRVRLNNSYASTEATVTTVVYEPGVEDLPRFRAGERVPVGRNIQNCRAYVLDEGLEPVPVGVPGYIYIAGPNVSRGYANWPDRTAASFIPDPFAEEMGYGPGQRMYRQGDVGRWLPSGDLEYLGRRDDQVKIRGFRVEPEEVGTVLARHPAVKDCIVLVRDDGPVGKRLVGYATLVPGSSGISARVKDLRDFLRESLPDHMIPAGLVLMDSLPLTSNGRVDRRALPDPASDRPETGGGFVAPQTAAEEILEGIWCEVLGVPRAGVNDNFFDLGGHSLLGTQVVSRVREQLRVELPLRAIFESPTLSSLARRIEDLRRTGGEAGPPRIEPVPREGLRDGALEVSFSQQRLWFLDRLEPGRATYNIPLALRFEGPLDAGALEVALQEIVWRHEALRTTFTAIDGRPYQLVHPPGPAELPVFDLSGLEPEERAVETRRRISEEARIPFSLEPGPLVRTALVRLGPDEHVLLVTMHHIVSDGWSVPIYIRELACLYEAVTTGKPAMPPTLPELPIQYADFARWQRQWLQGDVLEKELAHWRERLRGLPAFIELPADRPRPAVRTWRGASRRISFEGGLAQALRTTARRLAATPFMVMLSAFAALLHRYSQQESFAVGVPVAGRNRIEIEPLIGFFVNTLVLRCDVTGATEVRALVEQLRDRVLDADAHQDVPFEKLVEELSPERSLSHTPLFQVMLAFQNLPREDFESRELKVTPMGVASGTAKFDLTLSVRANEDRMIFDLEHSTELFDDATLDRLTGHLVRLLEGALASPGRQVADLPLLSPGEERQLVQWNETAVAYPTDVCLHELIEAQVKRSPERQAVTFEGRSLTYRELDGAADRLALRLQEAGTGPEAVVGVLAERSLEMVVALLAVLKAGGAHLPLDPDYPADRLAFMIADARLPVLLAQERLLKKLPAHEARVLPLEGTAEAGEDAQRPGAKAVPENLAYVIYTSGSTGRPKGTLVPHRAIVNHMLWMQSTFPLGPSDRVLQKTPFSFDASVWEFWAPLLAGATLVMAPPEAHRDPAALARSIQRHEATVLQTVPSLLRAMLDDGRLEGCRSLRRVFCGGEELTADAAADFFRVSEAELHNLYGPTETAVDASCWTCERAGRRAPVPIGRPVANTRLYAVDPRLRPAPAGVPGELLIGGAQVGRGYLARPDLTAERFIPDPFSGEPGARLYRTGDLARQLTDGAMVFLGRIDHQVKLRGQRIELGEIEAALRCHPAVSRAAVVVRDDKIAAYYVPADGHEAMIADQRAGLRAGLRETLPEYMIPSWFVPLSALPLTASGKVDRGALPAPNGGRQDLGREYVAPEGDVQQRLASIWAEILRVDRIGANDNFFELGGHSLMATQVLSRVEKAFGIELALRVLFESPTLASLAEAIVQKGFERADNDLLAKLLAELEGEPA